MSKICERNHPVVKNIRKAMEEREICIDELSEKSGIICNDLEKILADKKVINPYEIACIPDFTAVISYFPESLSEEERYQPEPGG